ncbi:MAG TPA: lipopolysaccharide heptosyltransferase family protein, partial [Firmicutes bacterium]|nr:lipopolysaccharide heptosyltransferase family protein [Bacillota bacterium]
MRTKAFDYKKAKEKMRITNPKQLNLKEINTVLVLAPFEVGNMMLCIPALEALKQAVSPLGNITVVTSKKTAGIVEGCKSVSRVIPFNAATAVNAIAEVYKKKYDLMINFTSYKRLSFVFGDLSAAKARVAYEAKEASAIFERVYNLTLHTIDEPQHRLFYYLNLVRFIGANTYDFNPKIWIKEDANKFALHYFEKKGIDCNKPMIGINPTLKDEKKRWSFNKFAQMVSTLRESEGAQVLVFSHKNEKSMLDEFMHITKEKCIHVDVSDYLKLAAISRYLWCFVCNEADYMHIFAPFTNVIAIWGDSDPDNNKPIGPNHEVLQSIDGSADSVPVSTVLDHVRNCF